MVPVPCPCLFRAQLRVRRNGVAAHCGALMEQETHDSAPIRILLGPMPEMLRTMIKDLLAHEADMLVVGESNDASAALSSAADIRADMLIAHTAQSPEANPIDSIVSVSPFCIFAIATSGTEATAVQIVREPISFESSSGSALASAIRETARRTACLKRVAGPQWLA
jgi:DNA-binding NarL/FixJ family response regulator